MMEKLLSLDLGLPLGLALQVMLGLGTLKHPQETPMEGQGTSAIAGTAPMCLALQTAQDSSGHQCARGCPETPVTISPSSQYLMVVT